MFINIRLFFVCLYLQIIWPCYIPYFNTFFIFFFFFTYIFDIYCIIIEKKKFLYTYVYNLILNTNHVSETKRKYWGRKYIILYYILIIYIFIVKRKTIYMYIYIPNCIVYELIKIYQYIYSCLLLYSLTIKINNNYIYICLSIIALYIANVANVTNIF